MSPAGLCPISLPALLLRQGFDPSGILVCRVSLHPHDRGEGFETTSDLVRANATVTYARMQDGQKFGAEASVLLLAAQPGMMASLIGLYCMRARRRGIAPGDIVYDYDFAHLFHSFIARARYPTFYDAFEMPGLKAEVGRTLRWPAPAMRSILRANHPLLAAQ